MRWQVLALALVIGGCSTGLEPSGAELKARWEAQNVFPANYKADLLAFLRTYLNNPEGVRAAAAAAPQLKRLGPGDRYIVCVRYNARGNDGRYDGLKTGAASYVSGKLDRFFDAPKNKVQELCGDAVFGPFPELGKLTR